MNYSTLQRLNALNEINEAINNPYGSTLTKEWNEIKAMIEKNIDTVLHSKSNIVPTKKELHYTLMDIIKQLQDWYEWQPSDWYMVDSHENTLNDYQRVTLRNQKTGESFETTTSNYSRSRQKAKYEKTIKPRSNFWSAN